MINELDADRSVGTWELYGRKYLARYSTVRANHTQCQPRWAPVNLTTGEFCYFFDFTLLTRDEAVKGCRKLNSTLPLPASPADDEIMRALSGRIPGMTSIMAMGPTFSLWINAIFEGMGYNVTM